jgi:hypothetical protein
MVDGVDNSKTSDLRKKLVGTLRHQFDLWLGEIGNDQTVNSTASPSMQLGEPEGKALVTET